MRAISALLPLALLGVCGLSAYAQHPIEVERAAAQGDYMAALVTYDRLPERRATLGAREAAAASAWGLGLPDRAIEEYDRILKDESLAPQKRARLFLSRGAIELQENRFQVASLFAERSVQQLAEPSPLRAQALLLWGQSLSRLGMAGKAEEKLEQALKESLSADRPDIHYQLAECQLILGKFDEARAHLEQVPLHHERTSKALRYLAQLAVERKDPGQITFWLTKGREDYPRDFLDSWVDYALMSAAIQEENVTRVLDLREQAATRFPPSDHWLTLLQAESEIFLWNEAHGLRGAVMSRPAEFRRKTLKGER